MPKCKICKVAFEPVRPLQVCCCWQHALEYAAKNREKRERRALLAGREKLKSLTDWLDKAQAVFNKFIRLRDKDLPCISCGTTSAVWCAGHYRTRKAANHLRFNEDNVHKQCNYHCNQMLSGNIANYRPALIEKIGIERVQALECNNERHTYTIDECREIIATYKQKIKELNND